ncbi:MAG: right-handed parallel beta-helix repeat-containing protein [Gemmatimonadaceae bacterium]|nr:right-handed parallel beta-helix repeat-containing protein [Gemmatimonadaceae bacterium]MCW5826479.1 right-handed parallel beta-helix repeat-containing protein [Gemmatimonadaceae bacterium]
MPRHCVAGSFWYYALVLAAVVAGCIDTPFVPPAASTRAITAASVGLEAIHGESFLRTTGAPNEYRRIIPTAGFTAPFELHIRNGTANGAHRATSASVRLDGETLLGPSAFNPNAVEWTIPVTVGATAEFVVTIAGKPGSFVEVTLRGTPIGDSAILFCPDGRPGSFAVLADAVAAAPEDGTVLVCDGEWALDEELIDKPITLRPQSPGGATILDSDPAPIGNTGRPAIWITGYSSGTVRIVDLTFRVRGRALVPTDLFARVEIDSSRFVGLSQITAFIVMARVPTLPNAFIEVRNSEFDSGQVGIFVLNGVEGFVHHNTFRNYNSSGVIHSGGNTAVHGFGRVEDNLFTDCVTDCIRSFASNVVIARNRVEVPIGPARLSGIFVSRTSPAASPAPDPIVVEDNVIVAVQLAGTPTDPLSWSLQRGIQVSDLAPSASPNVIRRNHIENAWVGIGGTMSNSGPGFIAHDNVVVGGVHPVAFSPGVASSVSRNDFIGAINSLSQSVNASSNFQCNWWGSAAGPTAPFHASVTPMQYTPWATVPIAGNAGVSCP